MELQQTIDQLGEFEVPGAVTFTKGNGGLIKANVKTKAGAAEVYLHGAQITGFQKTDEPPLLFMSRLSGFAPGKAIRGGVPICFPWFGPRADDVAHGFARVTEWQVVETAAAPEGGVTLRLRLPETTAKSQWPPFSAEFVLTFNEKLSMELIITNQAKDQPLVFENCLHTYFAVGDIREVSISGLKSNQFLDKTDDGKQKLESAEALRITAETNRVYFDTSNSVEIRDEKLRRKILIEKTGSATTVLWNPWTTQKMDDLGEEEFQRMVCVESANVGPNKITLPAGKASRLKVVLSSYAA